MATVTDFAVVDEDGMAVRADPHGNNVAFSCACGAPVLAVMREHQRGASPDNPAKCSCGLSFWLESQESQKQVIVHPLR
jgi:hypothetical protein